MTASPFSRSPPESAALEVALGGDVMTGRGVDQLLAHPSNPEIFEDYIRDARQYVALAEKRSGPIPRPVGFDYPWGDALVDLRGADVRIVNLETSVTSSMEVWPDKGINYRMHPENVGCLEAAGIDVAVLANNHVLDWGRSGLLETLSTLASAGVKTVGAGQTAAAAEAPVVISAAPRSQRSRRVLVLAVAEPDSGVPLAWEATSDTAGIALLRDLGDAGADAIVRRIQVSRQRDDLVVVSIHWGPNWGHVVDDAHVRFAHALVERGVDVVFGHSSHHPRPIEIHRGKPILYGCGDLINDYEGISGYEAFRNELVLLYVLRCDARGIEVRMRPFRIAKMRLECASPSDASWLAESLSKWSRPHGTRVFTRGDGWLVACSARGSG